MLTKLKSKSNRARDVLRRLFRSSSPEPSAVPLEHTGWDGLETLVCWLSNQSGELSELTSAIGRLSVCVKMFDAQARALSEYLQLGLDMDELFAHLAREMSTPSPLPMHKSHKRIVQFARSLDREIEPLLGMTQESPGDEEALAINNLIEVFKRYRRVRTLLALLVLSENTTIWKVHNDEEIATGLRSLPHTPAAYYRYSGPDAVSRNGCTLGTCEAVLLDLRDWVHYGKSQNIRWLNGTAGIGKTTVAYSLCNYLESTGKPFACVFCSREHLPCRGVNQILPTISYQLAQQSLPFRCAMLSELEQDVEILRLPFDAQFRKLIARPLGQVAHTFISDPVIVIDGIEECEDKDMIYRLLRVLVQQVFELPIKLLISILPSRKTHEYMRDTPGERHLFELRLHELDRTVARSEIKIYLAAKLQHLNLNTTTLEQLAQRSGASFVYATALVQYLGEADSSEHVEQLQRLLAVSESADPNYHDPDVRYSFITQATLHGGALEDSTRGNLLRLLRTHIQEEAPPSLNITAGLLGLRFDVGTQAMLRLLLPVLRASGPDGLTLLLEKPFAAYFLSRLHSDTGLYQDPAQAHAQLARGCFDMIHSTESSFNFCDLESSCLLDREVSCLTERTNDMISPGLFYACLRWETHLKLADMAEDLYSRLEIFLSTRLLLWMEVLNLKKCLPTGVSLLYSLRKTLRRSTCSDKITRLVEDACEFVSIFSTSPISQSTPQIYVSALQFWSRPGPIREYYCQKLRSLVNTTEEWPARQSPAITTPDLAIRLPEASDTAAETHVANSDKSNRLLQDDAAKPLAGHTDWVRSVAYSPDGAYIASGSDDKTIRIWDARTGKPLGQPLTGHTALVDPVAYSPDGAYIASGSADYKIRIWDARTGKPVGHPLIGHTGPVQSVTYSPDGAYIASGSNDKTIRIWDARRGKPVGLPLTGHTSAVKSVAYSPDGACIASGSYDSTIMIWGARTRVPVSGPLTGQTKTVRSVAYSPDGAYIVSGSDDKTIQIWDARSGKPILQPLTAHTDCVHSVAYSPDGAYIASGSYDKTIRVWEARRIGKPICQPLTGHTEWVYSVAYSPDGAYIASGSSDNSIRVWLAPTRPKPKRIQPPASFGPPAIRSSHHSFWPTPQSTNRTTRTSRSNHTHKASRMLNQQVVVTTPITASPHDWTMREDGWVVGPSQERLIWVPPDLRDKLAPPRTKAIMSTQSRIVFDFREAKLGLDWNDCYNPS